MSQTNDAGISLFQPSSINWSYLSLGNVALNQMNRNNNAKIFIPSQKIGIIADNKGGKKFSKVGPSHPPKKKVGKCDITKSPYRK